MFQFAISLTSSKFSNMSKSCLQLFLPRSLLGIRATSTGNFLSFPKIVKYGVRVVNCVAGDARWAIKMPGKRKS